MFPDTPCGKRRFHPPCDDHLIETLTSGHGLVEGPCVDADGAVWFSDVLGGGVYRLPPGGEPETVIPKRRGVGGLALHRDGGVVASGRDVIHVRAGSTRVLLALEGATGFNDIATDRDGRVIAGVLRFHPLKGEAPVPGDVVRIDAPEDATRLFGGITWPNGIGHSPDGRTLYVSDYASGEVIAHDVAEGGEPGNRRVFVQVPSGSPDGLAVDEAGGVWVALGDAGGVARFAPGGQLDHVLDVPASFVASVCFGGDDRRDLYVTTAGDGCVFRTRVEVPGRPVTPAAV
jgi:gluconolactonase